MGCRVVKKSMTIYSAVLIGCQRVTDGQTDVQPISITCFSIADARKKLKLLLFAHPKWMIRFLYFLHNDSTHRRNDIFRIFLTVLYLYRGSNFPLLHIGLANRF